jgi:hypothetical protein
MNDRQEQWSGPEVVLDALYPNLGWIDGDVFEIDENTWAIHGVIAVDGDVILAEFDKPEEARAALARLAVTEGGKEARCE